MTTNNQPKEITAEQFIDQYFKKIGIGGAVKPEQFWKLLNKRFGKAADQFGDCIEARENGKKVDPYSLKNQTVEFANAVAAQFDAAKLRSTALWFIREQFHLKDKVVLEVGCDNGILLCMFATIFPETQFIGIDLCEPAIKIAKERAKYLELSNIRFEVTPLGMLAKDADRPGFDLIFSVATFHEILFDGLIGSPDPISAFSIEEADAELQPKCNAVNELTALSKLLSPGGNFISVDRWPTQYELLRWIRLNEKSGLFCSLSQSNAIKYKNSSGQSEILPLTVFVNEVKAPLLACDILSFKAYPSFAEKNAYHLIEDMMVAEMIYSALTKEEVYFQESIYDDGSGTSRVTIGVASGLGYIYTAATTGYRKLALLPSALLYEKVHEVSEVARRNAEAVATVNYRWGDAALLSRLSIAPISEA